MGDARIELTGCRILVVEDEYMIAVELERWLREAGAEVAGPVPNTDDALALIGVEPPLDAAILDVNLGGETAYPIAARLEEVGVPFLFATGEVLPSAGNPFGDRPRLDKPILKRELLHAVRVLLRGRTVRAG